MIVTLGQVLKGIKSSGIVGTDDREKGIDLVRRAIELAVYKGNLDPTLGKMDICSDHCGIVTLPSFVGTVLQVNVGGHPTVFRSGWYEFHINGFGNCCGQTCGWVTDDMGWSPVFQDLTEWSVVAAICEDATDGDGSLKMIVEGETIDANNNPKDAITIPETGPSSAGVEIPLLHNYASTDAIPTYFRKITRVTKPVTRGYVKLIAFPIRQMALSVNVGYYAPNEISPRYRRIKIGAKCKWARIIYRRSELPLVNDWDVLPIAAYQAMLDLVKSIVKSDADDIDGAEIFLSRAVRLMNEIQSAESGSPYGVMQVQPGFGVSTIDFR